MTCFFRDGYQMKPVVVRIMNTKSDGIWSKHRVPSHHQSPDLSHATSDNDSEIVNMFKGFAKKLDTKHDKHERLVKRSRDVTIESKRIIFALHRVRDEQDQLLMEEAAERLKALESSGLKGIANELFGEDPYMFMRAISPGLQEYIEALTFYFYLLQGRLLLCSDVQGRLTYRPQSDLCSGDLTESAKTAETEVAPTSSVGSASVSADGSESNSVAASVSTDGHQVESAGPVEDDVQNRTRQQTSGDNLLQLPLPYHEYILGVADLTGELMRRCIHSVSSGQSDQCWKLRQFLRHIHDGFHRIGNTGPREVTRKMSTLRQSLAKVETACYQLKVRGEEIPQHMLADVLSGISAGDGGPELE